MPNDDVITGSIFVQVFDDLTIKAVLLGLYMLGKISLIKVKSKA